MVAHILSKRAFRFSALALIVQTWLTVTIAFGTEIFSGFASLFLPFVLTLAVLTGQQLILVLINRALLSRFPGPDNMFYRLAAVLPAGLLLNVIALSLIYSIYPFIGTGLTLLPGRLGWSILAAVFIGTVLTFIREGISNFEAWKAALEQTEQLSNTYHRSRIFGLQGQLNPHFLFNCFNSLSGLVHEDSDKAERFLDQMTFVHRYLLGNGSEQLVPASEEVRFAQAYLHLAAERFGEGLKVVIDLERLEADWKLPPLSMQVILEDIMQRNALGKSNPLLLRIYRNGSNELCIENSINGKKNAGPGEPSAGISNLMEKFRLLHSTGLQIEKKDGMEQVRLPLFTGENERS